MKRQHRISTFTMFFLCIGLLTIGASLAHADGKVYPGGMCYKNPSGKGTLNYGAGSIVNTSPTYTLVVDCPAIHDRWDIRSGWVRVTDQHESADIHCYLESIYRSGSSIFMSKTGPRSSVGSSPNVQQLSFDALDATPLSHYLYVCYIPPAYAGKTSELHTYQVVEND